MPQAAEKQKPAVAGRRNGVVISMSGPHVIDHDKYGFIRDGGGKDWFFHVSTVVGPAPCEGDTVSFLPVVMGRAGKADRAINVRVVRDEQ